jgi:hypothetical protein
LQIKGFTPIRSISCTPGHTLCKFISQRNESKTWEETVKALALFVVVAFVFLGAGAVYAMGGGGHNGDGRTVVPQSGANAGSATNTNGQYANAGSATNNNGQYAGRCQTDPSSGDPAFTASVPEPLAALLLGLGIVGLAGARRKFKK